MGGDNIPYFGYKLTFAPLGREGMVKGKGEAGSQENEREGETHKFEEIWTGKGYAGEIAKYW